MDKHLYRVMITQPQLKILGILRIFKITVKSLEHTHKYVFSRLDLQVQSTNLTHSRLEKFSNRLSPSKKYPNSLFIVWHQNQSTSPKAQSTNPFYSRLTLSIQSTTNIFPETQYPYQPNYSRLNPYISRLTFVILFFQSTTLLPQSTNSSL